jgi:hypothetical protein
MVDALREAHRVLTPSGVLIDVRPVAAPIVVEVVTATQAVWAKTVDAYSTPEDIAAVDTGYSTLYRADGSSSRRIYLSVSRSIAIVPPS